MKWLFDWLDARTGYKKLAHEALYENIPGGARWRYVWGSTLTFALAVQFITGVFLWMSYSPSSQTAWESVFYIQNKMFGGWFLRGLHHYTAQMMTILLVLHLMQVVIDGAYKAPREVNFWFGLILLQLVLALSLTGYLLPWDQKGFWATKVSTNLVGITPLIGPQLQKLVIGGMDYGHHTLTRFFALHAGVLPGLVVALLAGHIYLFRRHGITAKRPIRKPDAAFWPDQVLMDSVACLAVLATVIFLIVRPRLGDPHALLGAELGAPADPSEAYSAARPEWYFLFLFQFLKYFPGRTEIIGAMIIPGILMGFIFLMPLLGQWRLGHRFNLGLLGCLIAGASLLTWLAVGEDRANANYQAAVREAERSADRVRELALSPAGIPSSALALLQNDPLTQGPKLFAKHCATCHRFGGEDGLGHAIKEPASAADLKGFGSREWVAGLLDPSKIVTTQYFGGTKLKDGKMVKYVQKDLGKISPEDLKRIAAAISAEAALPGQAAKDKSDAPLIAEGRDLIVKGTVRCTECHAFQKKDEDATAPELTGYASREWLGGLLNDPGHAQYYGKRNDRMPAFGKDKRLNQREIGLIADWLRGEWFRPGENAVAAQ